MSDKFRMNEFNIFGGEEKFLFEEFLADLDLVFEIGDDFNEIGEALSLIFFD